MCCRLFVRDLLPFICLCTKYTYFFLSRLELNHTMVQYKLDDNPSQRLQSLETKHRCNTYGNSHAVYDCEIYFDVG